VWGVVFLACVGWIWSYRGASADQAARAEIVPHKLQTTLIWWIDDGVQDAEDFVEWAGALERPKSCALGC
jgi:hypothetical protein